jgi:hypothetical protein
MLNFFRRIAQRQNGSVPLPAMWIEDQLAAVRYAEAAGAVLPGKRITSSLYRHLDLRLDKDMTGMYRIGVYEGRERRYSFIVRTPAGDYDGLKSAYQVVLGFLDGDRRIASLPDLPGIKGFYFGDQESPG